MTRYVFLLVLAAAMGGCVSSDEASNGAIRVLHAVPDAPRMNMYFNDGLQASGFDYRAASAYIAVTAGGYQVRIEEQLPSGASPATRKIFDEPVNLAVNDEVTLVIVGSAADNSEEVLRIVTTTRGVPTGKTRLQAVHAAPGAPPVDIYVLAPDELVTASTPAASALGYKSWTGQADVTAATNRLVITAAGDPATVLLESNNVFLPLEGTLLVAVVANTGLDANVHPVSVVFLTSTGSGLVADKDTPAYLRLANASPGAYTLDAFVNATSVDDTARQDCDPQSSEDGTLLEKCALPYEFVGPYDELDPANYDIKLQKSADPAVSARAFAIGLGAASQLTALARGLIADSATETTVLLQSLADTRRVATAAQLRIVDASVAADDAVSGDPSTDRLELYITGACASLEGETPDFSGLASGSDTGYRSYLAGDYQLSFTRTDTAASPVVPEILLSKRVTLTEGGVYTLVIDDSVGGVQPVKFLSLDDDAALADCPAPP